MTKYFQANHLETSKGHTKVISSFELSEYLIKNWG